MAKYFYNQYFGFSFSVLIFIQWSNTANLVWNLIYIILDTTSAAVDGVDDHDTVNAEGTTSMAVERWFQSQNKYLLGTV